MVKSYVQHSKSKLRTQPGLKLNPEMNNRLKIKKIELQDVGPQWRQLIDWVPKSFEKIRPFEGMIFSIKNGINCKFRLIWLF